MLRSTVFHATRRRRSAGLRAGLLAALLVLAALAAGSAAASGGAARVSPGAGGIHQVFRVSVRRTVTTGRSGMFMTYDTVSVGGSRRGRCVSSAAETMPNGPAGSTATVAFDPRRLGGHWCPGTFGGEIVQHEMSRCGTPQRFAHPAVVCPMMVVAPRTVARFHFVVR